MGVIVSIPHSPSELPLADHLTHVLDYKLPGFDPLLRAEPTTLPWGVYESHVCRLKQLETLVATPCLAAAAYDALRFGRSIDTLVGVANAVPVRKSRPAAALVRLIPGMHQLL